VSAADKLADVARAHGWTAQVSTSSGEWGGQVVEQTVVRLRKGDMRAAACWENGRFRSGFVLGRLDKRAFPWRVGAKRLREVLEGTEGAT
jgi:hypothetical protein